MRGSNKELFAGSCAAAQNRRQNDDPCFPPRTLFASTSSPPYSAAQGSLFNGADNPPEDEGLGNRDTPATKLEASPGKRFGQKASKEEAPTSTTLCLPSGRFSVKVSVVATISLETWAT